MKGTVVDAIMGKASDLGFGISYEALRAYQLKGFRNGNWRRLDGIKRVFYRACVAYASVRRVIRNPRLVSLLRDIIEELKSTVRVRALKEAVREVERVVPIYLKAGVFRWAPQLVRWLRDESYLAWLGFKKLNTPTLFRIPDS